jgi:hypothetical protein
VLVLLISASCRWTLEAEEQYIRAVEEDTKRQQLEAEEEFWAVATQGGQSQIMGMQPEMGRGAAETLRLLINERPGIAEIENADHELALHCALEVCAPDEVSSRLPFLDSLFGCCLRLSKY